MIEGNLTTEDDLYSCRRCAQYVRIDCLAAPSFWLQLPIELFDDSLDSDSAEKLISQIKGYVEPSGRTFRIRRDEGNYYLITCGEVAQFFLRLSYEDTWDDAVKWRNPGLQELYNAVVAANSQVQYTAPRHIHDL